MYNGYMYKISLNLNEGQIEYLKTLPGKTSEHIRRAIDKYIEDIKRLQVSTSASNGSNTNPQS